MKRSPRKTATGQLSTSDTKPIWNVRYIELGNTIRPTNVYVYESILSLEIGALERFSMQRGGGTNTNKCCGKSGGRSNTKEVPLDFKVGWGVHTPPRGPRHPVSAHLL